MTRTTELTDLCAITRARYVQRQQSFAQLLAEEQRIRDELARLDDMDRVNRRTDEAAIPMRAIGADMIWQGWIGRSRAALNMALARVLSVKEKHLAEVKRAYGKVLVAQELLDDLNRQERKKGAAGALSAAINQAVHR